MLSKLTSFVIFRYIVSGGTAAVVDLGLLYILYDVMEIHYLTAAILAFLCAFVVSFTLQKFWTFRNTSRENMHAQVVAYLGSSLLGLALNTLLMYIFVDLLSVHVLLAQVFAGAMVACCTFFIARVVFRAKPTVQ
jgi:putative flippase GtrA